MRSREVRRQFLADMRRVDPDLARSYKRGQPHNSQPCDIRAAFAEYVDFMAREGDISARVAQSATLDAR